MHEFKVWGPKAAKMAVKVEESVYPMTPVTTDSVHGARETGWWHVSVASAHPGTDYGFLVDEDPTAYPDPRSAWQPHGVHGLSRLYDHSTFGWGDQHWHAPPLSSAIIYELHIGTFTQAGTFDAAIERLDALVDIGVTHVEVMPIAAFPGDYGWGYDGVALFAVQNVYGGPDGFKRFVDACHARGLAVLLDVVYNHFGPVGNYNGKYGPYIIDRHHTPWGGAVNFEDTGSDEVRRFFCDNAQMWMRDYHVDGLRLDAVHEFFDRSAVHFMEQLSAEVATLSAQLGRRLVLIAESDLNDPRVVTPREAGGYGMDAQWSDDFHHALFTVLNTGEPGRGYYDDFGSFANLAKALTHVFVYDGQHSVNRGRSHGRSPRGLSAHHFLGFIQNHDQVGNRATGDRLERIPAVGFDRAKIAAGIVFTSPCIPMIFQGEEFAASTPFQYFAHHEDPAMAKSVFEGRVREFAAFGWQPDLIPNPESVETFQRSKLNWDEAFEGSHASMRDWYRRLIHFRRGSASLNDGNLDHVKVEFNEERRWLMMERGRVMVICNLGSEPLELDSPAGYRLELASRIGVVMERRRVSVPPETLAILSGEEQP